MTDRAMLDHARHLRRTLEQRLRQWDGQDPRTAEGPDSREQDLAGRPLFLLGAGAQLAQPFVAQALAGYDVRGLVDNQPSAALRHSLVSGAARGVPLLDDAGFRHAATTTPGALAVLCACGEAGMAHFTALAASAGVPALTLIQALRRTPQPDWAGYFADAGTLTRLHAALDHELCFAADPLSQATCCALLLHRLTGAAGWLAPVARPEAEAYFFTDALQPHAAEVLVDGGAYSGDTIRAFRRCTGDRWRQLHAFEPDPACHPALRTTLAGLPAAAMHPFGLWSTPGTVPMVVEGHARVRPDAAPETPGTPETPGMPVTALDACDLGPVTLIKLDIEGAEQAALHGARATLARYRPRLAVCVYHRPDDLLEIPRLLAALRPDSRLRLRHHGPTLFETVLYVTDA